MLTLGGTRIRRMLAYAASLSILIAGLFAISTPAANAADREFAPRFSTNTNGDIDMFGNTVMTCNLAEAGCAAARNAPVSATANAAVNNNAYNMVYIDVDSDPTTFNSSQATVSIPSGAEVLFAGLYWGGETPAGVNGTAAPNANLRNTVRLRAPGDASYSTITAAQVDDGAIIYQGFADITSRVAGAGSGVYTVANIQTATGRDRLGGWTIVLAYRDTTQPVRNLTVFDGLKSIGNGQTGTINVSGFTTPPAGPVNTTVGFVTYEGDLGLVGDTASLNGKTLSDAQHPATNFFSSRSSRNGVLRTGANPSYDNNLGFEHSMLTVDNTFVLNGATSATIRLTSQGDVYAPGVVTFATELFAPKIDQTKTVVDVNGGEVEQGDTLRYTISGTNNGSDGAAGFILRDPIPANTAYKPGTIRVTQPGGVSTARTDAAGDDVAEYDAAGNRIIARLGTGASATAGGLVSPGASYSVTFDVVVGGPNPVVPDGTVITNTATSSFSSQTLGTPLTAVNPAQSTVRGPDLAITKSLTGGPLVQGNNGTFTLAVNNGGPVASQGTVTVTDILPAGLSYVSASGTGWTCSESGGTVTCIRSDALAPTASYPPITLVVMVDNAAPANVANTATVSGGGDGSLGNNSSTVSAPTVAISDMALAKIASPTSVPVGGTVTYSLRVTNNGPSASTGSTVQDTLPAGMYYAASGPECTADAMLTTVTCEMGPLASGASRTIDFTAIAKLGTAGSTQTNSARVFAHQNDPSAGNNTASAPVSVNPVDLVITSQIQGNPAELVQGQNYTWLLDVANLGTSPAADSVVRFTVPAGVTLSNLDPRCVLDGPQAIVCDLGTVGPNATVPQIQVTGTIGAGAPAMIMTNASVTTSEPDADPSNNTATTDTPRRQSVDLGVTLTSDVTSAGVGDPITFTATVTNDGPGSPVNPVLTVRIPDGTTFDSAAPGCTYDNSTRTVTCTLDAADLAPGASVTRDIVVYVNPDATGPFTATAGVDNDIPDSDPSNNAASSSVIFINEAGLSIEKAVDKADAAPGDTLTYTLYVDNSGPSNARNVVVADVLPAGVTYVSNDAGCTVSGMTLDCPLGTIPAGGSRTVTITATVDPVNATPPAGTHDLTATKTETHLSIPAASIGTATATCPSGYYATDGSVRLDSVDQNAGTFADLTVLESRATTDGRGWTGRVQNLTTSQAQGKVTVVCLSDTTVAGNGAQHDVVIGSPVTASMVLTAGSWTVPLDCGPGSRVVAPGWHFTSGAGTITRSSHDGPNGWVFEVLVPESAEVTFEISCLDEQVGVSDGHTHDLQFTQLSGSVTVPAGGRAQTSLTCGDNAKGIVGGWSGPEGVQLVSLGNNPEPKIRVFAFYNPTASPVTVDVYLLCLEMRTGGPRAVTTLTNTATVSSSTPDTDLTNNVSSATTTVTAPSPAPPAPAPTSPAPTATVLKSAKIAKNGRIVRLAVRLDGEQTVRVVAKAGKKVVARGKTTADSGRRVVKLKVTKKMRAKIRSGKLKRVKVIAKAPQGRIVKRVRLS